MKRKLKKSAEFPLFLRSRYANHTDSVWASIYGAMIANQISDHMRHGHGAPDDKTILSFMEEAEYIATNEENLLAGFFDEKAKKDS